ncbi:MAG: hypothetical protein COB58_09820 [Thalassobium sp.]|nr:MAG: hypothetical protein COB43_12270 [Oceanospirillales bacterium]PHQ85138.1 MAG: hypothetical protein COB58_09820 [Thalassobium sp.]
MKKQTLEAHEYALADVFCDKYEFEIPGYQRPYSWQVEQATTLVDDLLLFLEDQPENIKDADPYFLGSLVLIKPDGPSSQVVDGQQRLTTLTILMSVLRTIMTDGFSNSLDMRIFQKGDEALMTDDKPRLKTRSQDQDFFFKYIQESNRLDELFSLNKKLSDSQSNILKNALAMHRLLEKNDEKVLQRLTKFLMTGCFVVVVTTPNVESAYRIFSVMNDRGLDLSPTDILKNHITSKISGKDGKQENYTKKWEDIEERIGRDNFKFLFSHIRMIEMRTKSRSNVVADFKNEIKPEKNPENFIDKKLVPYSEAYSDILDENYSGTLYVEDINNSFRWLNRIDNNDWVPAAIYYLSKYSNDAERLLKFFRLLERLASILMINRVAINNRISRYAKLIAVIDAGTEFSESSPLHLVDSEKKSALQQINGPIYEVGQIRVMVLLRLDSEISDGMAVYDHPRITVEHVMPQHPNKDSQWKKWCPSVLDHENLVHCLGNLALLSRTKNSAANNYEFEKKKTAYFNPRNGHSAFVLTNEIIKEKEWTPTVIEARQKRLVNKLIEVWDLN